MKLFSIPNLFTIGNLFCGLLGIFVLIVNPEISDLTVLAIAILLAISLLFDFLDGFLARMLKQKSEIGVQLDSFADSISFGVLPSFLLLIYFSSSELEYWAQFFNDKNNLIGIFYTVGENEEAFAEVNRLILKESILPRLLLSVSILLIPVFSILRLVKFNNLGKELSYFQGLPTPANAVLIFALVASLHFQPEQFLLNAFAKPWAMLVFVVLDCILLISNIPLFSLKFKKSVSVKNYMPQLVFLLLFVPFLFFAQWTGLFFSILLYIQLSLIFRNKIECQ